MSKKKNDNDRRFNDPLAHGPFTEKTVDIMNEWSRTGFDQCLKRARKRQEEERRAKGDNAK